MSSKLQANLSLLDLQYSIVERDLLHQFRENPAIDVLSPSIDIWSNYSLLITSDVILPWLCLEESCQVVLARIPFSLRLSLPLFHLLTPTPAHYKPPVSLVLWNWSLSLSLFVVIVQLVRHVQLLKLHGLYHASLLCPPSLSWVCLHPCSLSPWCYLSISSSPTPSSSLSSVLPSTRHFAIESSFTSSVQSIGEQGVLPQLDPGYSKCDGISRWWET